MSSIVKSKPIMWQYVTPQVEHDHPAMVLGLSGHSRIVGFFASEERRKEIASKLILDMVGTLPDGSTEYDNRRYQMTMDSILSNPIINAAANGFINLKQIAMGLGPRGITRTI